MQKKINWLDRFILSIAPHWGQKRIKSRLVAEVARRHYEAASSDRRTAGWTRSQSDVNTAAAPAILALRGHARDLVRNNSWARKAVKSIVSHTVGWGIRPKAVGPRAEIAMSLWRKWAETTECDVDSRLNFYGLQALAMRSIVESGEVLVRIKYRSKSEGLTLPIQLQVLEGDFIDSSKTSTRGQFGGPVIQGIEFDKKFKRRGYWLFSEHPGGAVNSSFESKLIPADEIVHVFTVDRPGQVRGVSWLAPAIVALKDFDEFEDASLMRQKIAACFAAFVTDIDGSGTPLGAASDDTADGQSTESLEPGTIEYLPPGRDIKFAVPPIEADNGFSVRTLRKIAAGMGISYEDLTGDYSQVNFSSARMSRLENQGYINDYRWNMLIPQFCDPVWAWAMGSAASVGLLSDVALPSSQWTPPPVPMLEPDKEGLAITRLIRAGALSPDEMVREQGFDPDIYWADYAASMQRINGLGIVLDSDASKTTQAGMQQQPDIGGVKNGN
jgi:lambda family phage portal protein